MSGQLRQHAGVANASQIGLHLARYATNFEWGRLPRIERLILTWSSGQKQEHNRLVSYEVRGSRGQRPVLQQRGQSQTRGSHSADL